MKKYGLVLGIWFWVLAGFSVSASSEVPAYVESEANRVINNVLEKADEENITFVLASDMHNAAYGELSDSRVLQINESNRHAGQAMNIIAEKIQLDFFANLGDFVWGQNHTTIEQGTSAIKETLEFQSGIIGKTDAILLPGNHDPLLYSYVQNQDYLDDDEIKTLIGSYNYRDYTDKKIRVIALNTSETESMNIKGNASAEGMTGEQLQWFAEALDLSAKADASEWGIIILSHHPLDWNTISPAANLLQAYLTGGTFSKLHHGVNVNYNFAGKNKATVIAQFHGHVHCEKVDYIHYLSNGKSVPTTVKRIAVPNACFYRNNEYGMNGKTEYYGIEFGEDITYNKTAGTKNDTAFNVVTIDRDNEKIYVYNYGAGYDRIIDYSDEPSEIIRISGETRYETSYKIADELREEMGVAQFSSVVIATGEDYADALSGSYLSYIKQAPIILTNGNDASRIETYLSKNLKTNGTVYLLGGAEAIPLSIEEALANYNIIRLSGRTRYETNLEILKETGLGSEELLVCTGLNYADCLSASATKRPILLVNQNLTDAQEAFLSTFQNKRIGTAAVNKSIENELKKFGKINRISGATRYETSIRVAETFVTEPEVVAVAYGGNYPDGLCGGVLAGWVNAPLLLAESTSSDVAGDYIDVHNLKNGIVLGGSSLIDDITVRKIFSMDTYSSIVLK